MKSNGAELEKNWSSAIGAVLRDLRKAENMTQEELAHNSGLSRASLQQIERGRTSIRLITLVRICAELEVQAAWAMALAGKLVESPQKLKEALERTERDAVPGRPRITRI